MIVLGLDAAVDWNKFGFAFAAFEAGCLSLGRVGTLDSPAHLEASLLPSLSRTERVLIAVDAPLGWPVALSDALIGR